jgi:hypothetical protein
MSLSHVSLSAIQAIDIPPPKASLRHVVSPSIRIGCLCWFGSHGHESQLCLLRLIGIHPFVFLKAVFIAHLPGVNENPHGLWFCEVVAWMLMHELTVLSLRPALKATEHSLIQHLEFIGRACRNKVEIDSVLLGHLSHCYLNMDRVDAKEQFNPFLLLFLFFPISTYFIPLGLVMILSHQARYLVMVSSVDHHSTFL